MKITDATTRKNLFNKALEKLEENKESDFVQKSILKLIRALLPYQSTESMTLLFDNYIVKVKNPSNFKEEKRYYRYR